MWHKLVGLSLILTTGFALAQAPGGVCTDDVAQSISNGVIVPIPYAKIYLCPSGSTATNCPAASASVNIYNSPTLSSGNEITNPFTADAGGNYFFCTSHGHYALEVVAAQGNIFIPDIVFADDWASGGTVAGTWAATSFVGPLTGNASTATALQNVPTNCGTGGGQYAYGIGANGDALCSPFPPATVPFYQTLKSNGTPVTQRYATNYSSNFVLSDSASPNQTSVDLASTIGVSITGNAGTASALQTAPTACAKPGQMTGIGVSGNAQCVSTIADEWFNFPGCSGGAPYNGDAACASTQTLPTPMADTNYFLECNATYPSGNPYSGQVAAGASVTTAIISASSFSYTLQYGYSGGSPSGFSAYLTCHAHHN